MRRCSIKRYPLLRSQLHRPLLLPVSLVGADLHQGPSEAAPVVGVGRRQLEEAKRERQMGGPNPNLNSSSAPPSLTTQVAYNCAACVGCN